MSDATVRQPAPTGEGADITALARQDVEAWGHLGPFSGPHEVYACLISLLVAVKRRRSAPGVGLATVQLAVSADLEARAQLGAAKYGTRLRAHNGRDAELDLYQELLDALVYQRQQLEENEIKVRRT